MRGSQVQKLLGSLQQLATLPQPFAQLLVLFRRLGVSSVPPGTCRNKKAAYRSRRSFSVQPVRRDCDTTNACCIARLLPSRCGSCEQCRNCRCWSLLYAAHRTPTGEWDQRAWRSQGRCPVARRLTQPDRSPTVSP